MSVVASRTRDQHAPVVIPLLRYIVRAAFAAGPTGKCQVVARLHFAACRGGDGAGDGADGGGLLSLLRRLDNMPQAGDDMMDQGNGRRGETQREGSRKDYGAGEGGGGGAAQEMACEVHDCGLRAVGLSICMYCIVPALQKTWWVWWGLALTQIN